MLVHQNKIIVNIITPHIIRAKGEIVYLMHFLYTSCDYILNESSFHSYERQSSMLCLFTNSCEVTMVKCYIGKSIYFFIDKIPIYIYNRIHVLVLSHMIGMICFLFSKCKKNSATWLRSLIKFYLSYKCFTLILYSFSLQCNKVYH